MRRVLPMLGSVFPETRKIVLLAAILAGLGLVASYLEISRAADRELALRRGPPAPIALQEFRPSQDIGPASEVSIRAEADYSNAKILAIPGSEPSKRALVVPLFPLSEAGARLVSDGRTRPTEPPLAEAVSQTEATRMERPGALGLILYPMRDGDPRRRGPSDLATQVFGMATHGTVIELNGRHADAGDFGLMAAGAFAASGIRLLKTHIAVEPYRDTRLAVLSAPDTSLHMSKLLFLAAFGTLIIAAIVALFSLAIDSLLRAREDDGRFYDDEALETATIHHPRFAPLPSQAEIKSAERASNARPAHWTATLAIGAGGPVSTILRAGRWIRNRLSHPGDGVL